MGKFSGVLLASDFDDTLYHPERKVSEENRRAIRYFTGEGGYFTVATGRAFATFAPHVDEVPVNAPVVLSNGSALYDFQAGRMVCQTFLPERSSRDLAELVRAVPELGLEAYHRGEIYLHNPNAVTWNHLSYTGVRGVERPVEDFPQPLSKVLLEQQRPVLERAREYIQTRWGEHYEAIFSNQVLLEMTCKGSNKGGMVLRLAELLGVERAHIYCVGDNENDLPMLAVSRIPFAPANCARAVRDWGPRLVGSCGESCIAQIIGILDEQYPGS